MSNNEKPLKMVTCPGCEAKVFSAVRAKHDSVGHLLESRSAAATSEVFEALRHRAARSIEEADVIERETLAGFSAPFNSFLSVHGKLGNSHRLIYTRLEDLAARVREYCRSDDSSRVTRLKQGSLTPSLRQTVGMIVQERLKLI